MEQAQEEPFFVVPANDDVEFTNISVISEEMKKGWAYHFRYMNNENIIFLLFLGHLRIMNLLK